MTDNVMIRSATEEDAKEILSIYEQYVKETAITFEYEVPTEEEFRGRIKKTLLKYPYLVAEVNGKIVGYSYLGPLKERAAYDWSAETTIYIRKDLHKKGVGRKLYEALEEAAKEIGIKNLYACIAYTKHEDEYLTNDSKYFHEHLGYKQNGLFQLCGYKFNRWYDMIWMEKLIGEHQ